MAVLAAFLVVPVLNMVISGLQTFAISQACQNSDTCREAAEKADEAEGQASESLESASLLETKVQELSAEISAQEAKIEDTEKKIMDLRAEIKKTEAKLKEKQEALAELLVNMHFDGDTEPIKILAGSSSISDLAEKASRGEVAKKQISTAAAAVRDTKEKLENNKREVEDLLADQQDTKKNLVSIRSEQKTLIQKYQNDAEAYEEVAKAAREEQRKAEQAEMEAHPELYRGISYYSGDNTYPWQADCPQKQDEYGTMINGVAIGGLVCECVSYAGWKAYERYGIAVSWGNAYNWDDAARSLGYRVDNTPAPGTIGQFDSGIYGHVFWVESVNDDGSINVTEYNNAYATQLYAGDFHFGDFGSQTIEAYKVGWYNYIHF